MSKFAPTKMDYKEHIMSLDVGTVRAIAAMKTVLDMSESTIPNKMVQTASNTLTSTAMTLEEEALGFFTRCKLKNLNTWEEWEKGEHKQLNQFYLQQMFGDPIDPQLLPNNVVVLRPLWQYAVKRSGV